MEKALHPFGEIKVAPFIFSHGQKKILITHVPFSIKKYADSGQYGAIIFGHTHKPEIQKRSRSLLINPGETGGWVSGKSTVALLDTEGWEVEIATL